MTRKGLLTALGAWLTGVGLLVAQPPETPPVYAPDPNAGYGAIPGYAPPPGYGYGYPANPYPQGYPVNPGWQMPEMYGPPAFSPQEGGELAYSGIVTAPPPVDQPFIFFGVDYRRMWFRSQPSPIVLTTSSQTDGGILGNATTNPLSGGSDTVLGATTGLQYHLDLMGERFGVSVGGYLNESRGHGQTFASDATGSPLLALPVTDPTFNVENAVVIASPGAQIGSVSVRQSFRTFGEEANAIWRYSHDADGHFYILAGVRLDSMRETFRVDASTTFLADTGIFATFGIPAGTTVTGFDNFATRNTFYGGQLGFDSEWHYEALFIRMKAKCAVGVTHESLNVSGSSTATQPDGTQLNAPGQVYAQTSNIGKMKRDVFTWMPEVALEAGVTVSDHLELHAGYSFLYWSSVARPGDAVDRRVNLDSAPLFDVGIRGGPPAPPLSIRSSEFWSHGVNAGATLRW